MKKRKKYIIENKSKYKKKSNCSNLFNENININKQTNIFIFLFVFASINADIYVY